MNTSILLARHGQTAWHSPNRYTGSSDIPLARAGEEQAERLAEWAVGARLTGLASSPLLRARFTAAPVVARTGLRARIDERLVELDFGAAEGHTMDEMRERAPEAVAAFLADPAANPWPGGERPAAAVARAHAALTDLAAADPGGRILVIAHSTLIRLVICAVLGVPLRDYRRRLPRLDPAAVSEISLPVPPAGAAATTVQESSGGAVLESSGGAVLESPGGAALESPGGAALESPGGAALESPGGAAPGVPGAALLAYNLPVATPTSQPADHISTGSR